MEKRVSRFHAHAHAQINTVAEAAVAAAAAVLVRVDVTAVSAVISAAAHTGVLLKIVLLIVRLTHHFLKSNQPRELPGACGADFVAKIHCRVDFTRSNDDTTCTRLLTCCCRVVLINFLRQNRCHCSVLHFRALLTVVIRQDFYVFELQPQLQLQER